VKKFGPLQLYKNKPTIIAEAGVNHGCNLSLALKYIKLAKEAGVDAIKFQTYKANKIVSKISPAYWDTNKEKTKSQFKLFKKFDKFDFKDYYKLFIKCKKEKILYMSTLFDIESIKQHNKFLKIFKISSSDINNIPLIREIGKKKKYTIISTGAATIVEIRRAIKVLALPKKKICIMHCVLNYPTKYDDANLNYIKTLKKEFPGFLIGYSDHTHSDYSLTPIRVAHELGAKIIEKHFTHNKNLIGNDHYHAAEKNNFVNFYKSLQITNKLYGKFKKNLKKEKKSIKFARRSIFSKLDIKKGEKLNPNKLITLRPGDGVSASFWDIVIKSTAKINISKFKKIEWKDLIL
jgi:N-acetylneuraminate synthase